MNWWHPQTARLKQWIREVCEEEGLPDVVALADDGPSDGSEPPIWETTPLHRMDEGDLMATVYELERERNFFEEEKAIQKAAGEAARRWSEQLGRSPFGGYRVQVPFIDPVSSVGTLADPNAPYPARETHFRSYAINLPDWLRDEDQARWLAERQLREQMEDHR